MATKKTLVEENVIEEKEEKELDPMRKVKIKLFKDGDKYRDDMIVGLNGRIYQIQRGVEVEVPWAVSEIIRRSIVQTQHAAEFSMREEQNFHDNVEKKLG